jgi:hypothetical protein
VSAPRSHRLPRWPLDRPRRHLNRGPDSFDAGDSGAVYLWHDGKGWHIRTTDKTPGAHHYSGTGDSKRHPDAATIEVRRAV